MVPALLNEDLQEDVPVTPGGTLLRTCTKVWMGLVGTITTGTSQLKAGLSTDLNGSLDVAHQHKLAQNASQGGLHMLPTR